MQNLTLAQLVSLLDLTRLEIIDEEKNIANLCKKALTSAGPVAAICVYSNFVPVVKNHLPTTSIKVAAVANFYSGDQALTSTLHEIENALQLGADEVDLVMPYHQLLLGKIAEVKNYVMSCRGQIPKSQVLKVIIESGALEKDEQIYLAAQIAIECGADFIKTSTGKSAIGATENAVKTILKAIKEHATGKNVGIKISGGIRTHDQMLSYLKIIEAEQGASWINSSNVRFGASQLLDDLLKQAL